MFIYYLVLQQYRKMEHGKYGILMVRFIHHLIMIIIVTWLF